MIYADNAATTKLDNDAFKAMKPWLMHEYGNPSSAYSFSRKPKQALKKARETIADCIHALPDEIYFTSGGTESDNWAIKGVANLGDKQNSIVTSSIEHSAVLNSCKSLERRGYHVTYLQPEQSGIITANTLEQNIIDDTFLVSVMLANNEIGTIEPIKELSSVAHAHNAIFHSDAVQAVGHIDIDVNELHIDMLSASAHKFGGPRGIGFLYVRQGIALPPYLDGGEQENGMRSGTENVANIVGMAVALKNSVDNLKSHQQHLTNLEQYLLKKLNDYNIAYTRNGGEERLPGLISLSFEGKSGEAILHRMDLMGICVSTGSACNSKSTQISHVLQAIRLPKTLANGTIRVSLSKDNTTEDVEAIAVALCKILSP